MPAPTTTNEFLDLVRRSCILDQKRLDAHVEKLRAANALPADPSRVAGVFVRDGLLTHFQAEQFLQGKWKRFTIGKYKVLERLGSGGMGSVYLCEHTLMRRRVAVKVLPAAKSDDPAALARFYREARAVAALDHPNIVRAYDIDQEDKLHFLVMEHVDGASLQEIVKKTGPMDVTRACHYIRQSALGLQHAHESANLVHRDIKPGNILVDRNGIVKVLDMGLARFFEDEQDDITRKYDENVLGTADYLAPEQALESHSADIRADIYSLGCTFYYCLTGKPPFADGTVAQKLIWHQTRQVRPITALRKDVPEGVLTVLDRMMAKDPLQRYQTPLVLAEALAPWTQTPIPPPPETEMPQLSPAAMGGFESQTAVSPSPRKNWQVPATPAPTAGSGSAPTAVRGTTPGVNGNFPPATATPGPAGSRPSVPPVPPPAPRPAPTPAAPPPQTRPAPGPATPAPRSGPMLQAMSVQPRPAPAPQPAPLQIPDPEPAPASPEELPWEKVVGETDDLGRGADTSPTGSRLRRQAGPPIDRRILIAGGAAIVVLVGVVIFLLTRVGGKPAPTTQSGEPKRGPLVVAPDSPYKSLHAALEKAGPNDVVVVKQDLTESLYVDSARAKKLRGVRIQAEPGKRITWRPPASGGQVGEGSLIQLFDVKNLTLEGFTLDGLGKADSLVQVNAGCSDVLLKRLELVNPGKSGIHFVSCVAKDKPIILTQVQTPDAWPATVPPLLFTVVKNQGVPELNSNVEVLADCKFGGLAPVVVRGKYENLDFRGEISGRVQFFP